MYVLRQTKINNMPKTIIIYSNCHGAVLASMFQNHGYTKRKYQVTHISNYINLSQNNTIISLEHSHLLSTCDDTFHMLKS